MQYFLQFNETCRIYELLQDGLFDWVRGFTSAPHLPVTCMWFHFYLFVLLPTSTNGISPRDE